MCEAAPLFLGPGIFVIAAWILLLLVTASVPITKSVDLVRITTVDGGFTVAKAGVFGICYPGGNYDFLNTTISAVSYCTGHLKGYKLDPDLLGGAALNISNALSENLSSALLMNAIACAFAGLAAILMAFGCCGVVAVAATSAIPIYFANLVGWAAWGINLAMPLVAQHRIHKSGMGDIFQAHIGNGVWMSLAALIMYTVSGCFAICGMCCVTCIALTASADVLSHLPACPLRASESPANDCVEKFLHARDSVPKVIRGVRMYILDLRSVLI